MLFEVSWGWAEHEHLCTPGAQPEAAIVSCCFQQHLGSMHTSAATQQRPAASRARGGIAHLATAELREPSAQLALAPPCPLCLLLLLMIISQGQGKSRKINILQVNSLESQRAGAGCVPWPGAPWGTEGPRGWRGLR